MSQTMKLVLGIVIAVMVLASGYLYWQHKMMQTSAGTPSEVTTLPSGNDTSDEALDKDLGSIDTQIQGVSSDNADVSASVTAVQQ